MADDAELRERTKKTAKMLFHTLKGGAGFETWKKFDKELARELSMFFAGKLYSREVISQKQRELCAVASLTVLHRPHELRAHVHAALNVGATRQQVADLILRSEEATDVLVGQLYQQFLHRPADDAGLQGWVTDIMNGMSAELIAAFIAGSQEYFNRF